MGNLGTNLATGLATNVATNLAGGADVPETLGALLHYDPHIAANVDIGTGISDYRPVVGSQTLDVLSESTPSAQPTYNEPGSFASGRNTMTFDLSASQKLSNTAMASLAVLDGLAPWTVCFVVAGFGSATRETVAAITDTSSTLNNIAVYLSGGTRPVVRYRSTAGIDEQFSGSPGVGTVPVWVVADFDGVDTLTIETSERARAVGTGASAVTGAVFDSLFLGGWSAIGYADVELGDYAVFPSKLGTTDRATLITWLAGRL